MAGSEEKGLLANKDYDNDATLVESDPGTDSEDDARDVQQGDEKVLEDAEEQEQLIRPDQPSGSLAKLFKKGEDRDRRRKRRSRRKSRNSRSQDDGQVMFEMEGGFKDSSSQSSVEIYDNKEWERGPPPRRRLAIIHIVVLALFVVLAFGAWHASKRKPGAPINTQTFWNGTHAFKPTTILISLDGFRADFLNRGLTPALNAFIASGVSPRYMLPSFPSVTFPNHFTLVTGLYPESHGIVSNQFWDPELQEEFYYTNPKSSMQPKWWTAEPLWVTAENQGVRTAVHMWPGSEAHIPNVEPTYVDKFNESETLSRKVDRLLGWLDLPGDDDPKDGDKRPQLLLSYVPDVDADGHLYGPNSTEIRATIADADSMLTMLVEGLLARNLTEIVNLVIVSDHGMATTSTKRVIQLDDLVDMSLIDHIDGWPLRGLRLRNPERDVPILHKQLLEASKEQESFDVYTRETMPERYHFSNNDRIAPLWIVPKTGWAVAEKKDFDVAAALQDGKTFVPKGLHGYDHEHPLMRAIFVARGPAFPHPPNSRVAVFQNTAVYNIVCDSLGIQPHPNNGTLHLPLKTEGLHSDAGAEQLETPHDADEDNSPAETSNADETVHPSVNPTTEAEPAATSTSEPGSDDEKQDDEKAKANWWSFLHDQLQKAKDWAKQFIDSIKGNHDKGNNDPPQS
jgi:predicted AlkP superfamily pyrophosphatase or phosphodiesterase